MDIEMTKEQRDTIEYYNTHADEYCDATRNVDMSALYVEFEKYLKPGCKILDLGCGSGRDSKYFHDKGYDVVAADPSTEMCKRTRELVPIEVFEMRAEDLELENEFDAVWACVSLLHVNRKELFSTIENLLKAIKKNAIIYISLKETKLSFEQTERTFVIYSETEINHLIEKFNFKFVKMWKTSDEMQRSQGWINILLEYNG